MRSSWRLKEIPRSRKVRPAKQTSRLPSSPLSLQGKRTERQKRKWRGLDKPDPSTSPAPAPALAKRGGATATMDPPAGFVRARNPAVAAPQSPLSPKGAHFRAAHHPRSTGSRCPGRVSSRPARSWPTGSSHSAKCPSTSLGTGRCWPTRISRSTCARWVSAARCALGAPPSSSGPLPRALRSRRLPASAPASRGPVPPDAIKGVFGHCSHGGPQAADWRIWGC